MLELFVNVIFHLLFIISMLNAMVTRLLRISMILVASSCNISLLTVKFNCNINIEKDTLKITIL